MKKGRAAVMVLDITDEISNSPFAEASLVNASEDYDLHLYTYDGRHVGMNYVTREYEIILMRHLIPINS